MSELNLLLVARIDIVSVRPVRAWRISRSVVMTEGAEGRTVRRPIHASLLVAGAPLVGLIIGATVVFTTTTRASELWLVWAPLAVGLGIAAGATIPYGVHRWRDLVSLHPITPSDVAQPTAAVGLVGIFGPSTTAFMTGAAHVNWRGLILIVFTVLAAVPTAAVMYGVRYVASTALMTRTPGETLAHLAALRRLLQRSLAVLGSLMSLVILEFAALLALEQSVGSDFGDRPPEYVLVFGGFGSLLVALVYVPGWSALQRQGQDLSERLFPIMALDDPSAIVNAVEKRQKVERTLGVNQSLLADMQAGVVILAPLLASAAAVFLPG